MSHGWLPCSQTQGKPSVQDEMAPLLLANEFHPSNVKESYVKKNAKTKINKKPESGKTVPTGEKKHYLCI